MIENNYIVKVDSYKHLKARYPDGVIVGSEALPPGNVLKMLMGDDALGMALFKIVGRNGPGGPLQLDYVRWYEVYDYDHQYESYFADALLNMKNTMSPTLSRKYLPYLSIKAFSLSNETGQCGASSLFYPTVFQKITSDHFKQDFYIIYMSSSEIWMFPARWMENKYPDSAERARALRVWGHNRNYYWPMGNVRRRTLWFRYCADARIIRAINL